VADKKDDDITDLTGDGNADGKGKDKTKNKKKKEKEPGQAVPQQAEVVKPVKKGKSKSEKTGKAGREKTGKAGREKKGGKLKLKLILILTPILLIAGFVAVLVINLFGVRDIVGGVVKGPILSAVVWFDPEFKSVDDELRAKNKERETGLKLRETDLNKREAGIAERETKLESWEELLDTRESQLTRRGTALDRREEQLKQAEQSDNSTVPQYRRVLSSGELEDMQSLSMSYAQMAPEKAAGILVELKDEVHVATILYYMVDRNAADILAVMEPRFAAKITEILLS